jgi:hypothetical protein
MKFFRSPSGPLQNPADICKSPFLSRKATRFFCRGIFFVHHQKPISRSSSFDDYCPFNQHNRTIWAMHGNWLVAVLLRDVWESGWDAFLSQPKFLNPWLLSGPQVINSVHVGRRGSPILDSQNKSPCHCALKLIQGSSTYTVAWPVIIIRWMPEGELVSSLCTEIRQIIVKINSFIVVRGSPISQIRQQLLRCKHTTSSGPCKSRSFLNVDTLAQNIPALILFGEFHPVWGIFQRKSLSLKY